MQQLISLLCDDQPRPRRSPFQRDWTILLGVACCFFLVVGGLFAIQNAPFFGVFRMAGSIGTYTLSIFLGIRCFFKGERG